MKNTLMKREAAQSRIIVKPFLRNVRIFQDMFSQPGGQHSPYPLKDHCLLYVQQVLTFKNLQFCPHSVFMYCIGLITDSDEFTIQH
jgi:hypothetical protein